MRHIPITVVSVAIVTICAAPAWAKCKIETDEPDLFETKTTPLKSKAVQAIGARLGVAEGEYFMVLVHNSGGRRAEFDDSTELSIVFSGGSEIHLVPAAPERASRTLLGLAINNRKAEILFSFDESTMDRFRTTPLARIDLNIIHDDEVGIVEFEIAKGPAERFMEYAECVWNRER